MHVSHDTAHVASVNENANGHHAFAVLAADVHGATADVEGGHLVQRDVHSLRGVHEHVLQIGQPSLCFRQSHDDAEMLFSLPQFRRRLAAQTGLDHIFDVRNVEAVAGGAVPVNFDERLRHLARPINEGAGNARHRQKTADEVLRVGPQNAGIIAEQFNDNLAVNLRNAFQHIVANRLREAGLDARNFVQLSIHFLDDLVLGHRPFPFR